MKDAILYEDNHLFAVNKPAGMLTQPSPVETESLETWAKGYIRESRGKPGEVWLEAVHRLDRQVSGAVLFACTSKAASRLSAAMRDRDVGKFYFAITDAVPNGIAEGSLENYLRHGSHEASVVSESRSGAKLARLHYRLTRQIGKLYLFEIQLETGRYHQIRAQFAYAGSPILGDLRYGSRKALDNEAVALHHRELTIVHPTLRTPLVIQAPFPTAAPWTHLAPR